ncbi:hypothetical protein MRB53_032651 [Persea americana]|uniref:Uncharacterized protein n=1 Tax=Persea americana TaxID=3435 RepID=A0ACC2KSI4_PERAE|nr:hypothetical protein MRB53_032651 [Persea americana]
MERKALIGNDGGEMVRIRDIMGGNQTLAYQLKPKMVVLRVSMHCNGCARKVKKHISKIDGVTSFEVDLQSKKVVVIGDVLPFEVLESISKSVGISKRPPLTSTSTMLDTFSFLIRRVDLTSDADMIGRGGGIGLLSRFIASDVLLPWSIVTD